MKKMIWILLFCITTTYGAVNINTASKSELMHLKGIGPSSADKIIAYRKLHKFQSIEELMKIKGIGQKKFNQLKSELDL